MKGFSVYIRTQTMLVFLFPCLPSSLSPQSLLPSLSPLPPSLPPSLSLTPSPPSLPPFLPPSLPPPSLLPPSSLPPSLTSYLFSIVLCTISLAGHHTLFVKRTLSVNSDPTSSMAWAKRCCGNQEKKFSGIVVWN